MSGDLADGGGREARVNDTGEQVEPTEEITPGTTLRGYRETLATLTTQLLEASQAELNAEEALRLARENRRAAEDRIPEAGLAALDKVVQVYRSSVGNDRVLLAAETARVATMIACGVSGKSLEKSQAAVAAAVKLATAPEGAPVVVAVHNTKLFDPRLSLSHGRRSSTPLSFSFSNRTYNPLTIQASVGPSGGFERYVTYTPGQVEVDGRNTEVYVDLGDGGITELVKLYFGDKAGSAPVGTIGSLQPRAAIVNMLSKLGIDHNKVGIGEEDTKQLLDEALKHLAETTYWSYNDADIVEAARLLAGDKIEFKLKAAIAEFLKAYSHISLDSLEKTVSNLLDLRGRDHGSGWIGRFIDYYLAGRILRGIERMAGATAYRPAARAFGAWVARLARL